MSLQWCYCVHHAAKDMGNVGILRLQHVATWGKKLDTGCCAIIPWVVSYRYKTKQSKALSDHQRGTHCPKDFMKIHTNYTTICSMTHTNALGQHFLHGTLWRCLLKPPNGLSQESIEGDYRWVGCKGAYKYARMNNDGLDPECSQRSIYVLKTKSQRGVTGRWWTLQVVGPRRDGP